MGSNAPTFRIALCIFATLSGFLGVQILFDSATTAVEAKPAPELPRVATIEPLKSEKPKIIPVALPKPEFPPGYNFASAEHGAKASGGIRPELLIDGDDTNYTGGTGFAYTVWQVKPPQYFLITLKKPFEMDCIRFLLWDREDTRYYRYKLEICADDKGENWKTVADRSANVDECRSWQLVRIEPQKVKLIKLTGTYNSANSGFHVVELQAFLGLPSEGEPAAAKTEDLDF